MMTFIKDLWRGITLLWALWAILGGGALYVAVLLWIIDRFGTVASLYVIAAIFVCIILGIISRFGRAHRVKEE